MMRNWLFSVLAIVLSTLLTIAFARPGIETYFAYVDFNAAMITLVFPFLFQWALFGPSGLKKAFAAGFRKDPSLGELEGALLFFKTYSKIIRLSVLLPLVIGTVAILKWVSPDDMTLTGPNLAMTLMSLLYAVILHGVIILPYSVMLKRRLMALNSEI
jgi:hypothetical protein